MTPEINEILKKISSAKGLTAILVLFFLGVFIWKNLDFLTEVSFTFKREGAAQTETKDKKGSGVAQLELGQVIVPPSPKKLPSVVVFEVRNPGNSVTKSVRVNIDLGVTTAIGYEVIGPNESEVTASEAGKPIINVDISQIRPHESAYIYIQTSTPTFRRVSVSSDSTNGVEELTLNDYLEGKASGSPSFSGFLLFLGGGFLLVMSAYFTMVIIAKLNKWLKMEW